MLRVLVYFGSPPLGKMAMFAASRVAEVVEIVDVDDPARALVLLEDGPWHLAIIGFVPDELVVEAYARAGVPTLVGVCVDRPEHEPMARQAGATQCWRWPMQVHLLTAMIRKQLGLGLSVLEGGGAAGGRASRGKPRLGEHEGGLLRELIERECGQSLTRDANAFLAQRLRARLSVLGLDSYGDYYQYLRYNPAGPREVEELIERITLRDTYFFREQYQLDALSEEVLPELAKRLAQKRRIKIWSAGCSTGEEVYTLAMILLESGLFRGWGIDALGTDISRRAIEAAQAAVYGEISFRTTSAELRQKYFVDCDGRWAVRDEVRAMCHFSQLNLLSTDRFRALGEPDLIVCRNVLMYLSPHVRHEIVGAFHGCLSPGGYLLLGHAEGLLLGRSNSL